MTGESSSDSVASYAKSEINQPELEFVLTKGQKGQEPKNIKIYEKEGQVFLRNHWDMNQDNQLFLREIAGIHSRVLKNRDELSILLSNGRTDFFVDSGKYIYQKNTESISEAQLLIILYL